MGGLKPKFSQNDFRKALNKKLEVVNQIIILRLQVLGEELVNHARTSGNYTDRTGNLRSSIGYVVVAKGQIVNTNFEQVKEGSQGVNKGRGLGQQLASKYLKGYALIVVAGMEYAGKVESKGYDVIASAEIMAEDELPKLKEKLKRQISGRK